MKKKLSFRSQWSTDKHIHGCYSFRSLKSEELNATASKLAEPILAKNGNPVRIILIQKD